MHKSAPAAPLNVSLTARVGPPPPEDHDVLFDSRLGARLPVSAASIGPLPLEDLEVAVLGSTRACLRVAGAPVGPRPLEHGQVAALCSTCTEVVSELLTGAGRRR